MAFCYSSPNRGRQVPFASVCWVTAVIQRDLVSAPVVLAARWEGDFLLDFEGRDHL